jgi:hypothetical protein
MQPGADSGAVMDSKSIPESEPLSWEEARSRLRKLLENYISDPPPPRRASDEEENASGESLLSWWISRDFDLYFGALALSICLLVLSCFSLSARSGGAGYSFLQPTASKFIYRAEMVAALLLVAGSYASLWMVRRRRFLGLNDSNNSKRRDILRFLRALSSYPEESGSIGSRSAQSDQTIRFNGTSLNDIYPVCRKSSAVDAIPVWTRIPSLLLVHGDYIALQIGDTAPANCGMVGSGAQVRVNVGDHMSLELLTQTAIEAMGDLPRGRTTLPPGSDHLLTLCNKKCIFLVLDAPIQDFINRPPGMCMLVYERVYSPLKVSYIEPLFSCSPYSYIQAISGL